MEKTELLACPLTDAEIIHIFENSRLQSEHFAQEAVTAAYVAALAALNHRTPSPDNMKTALLPLEFVFGHGAFGVGSVSEDENAPIREIIVYRLPNPVLPAGTTLGDVGKHVEELENVLVRMRFESVESAHVFERSVSRVLDSFGETDNCTNAECPYQHGAPCPAADGCGGFVPDNKPLTAEELREMNGEPVWVKSGGRVFACIVQKRQLPNTNVFAHGFHDYDGIRLVHDVTFTFMASDVDCYRRPPEEGEQTMPLLNPCPVCGKQPVTQCVEVYRVQYKLFCGVHVSVGDWFPNTEAAEKDWNRRTTDPMQPDLYKSTNADRIRAMSDEELAVTLACPNEMGMAEIPCDHSNGKNCCACLLDWLSQPAEGD